MTAPGPKIFRNGSKTGGGYASPGQHQVRSHQPPAFVLELSPRLPENCIITCDSGSAANWFARDLKVRRGMMASLSGGLVNHVSRGSLCDSRQVLLPRAGGHRRSGRRSHADVGKCRAVDYFQVLAEMVGSAAGGAGLHNNDLNQVSWEQRVISGRLSEFRSIAEPAGFSLRPLCRNDRAQRHLFISAR